MSHELQSIFNGRYEPLRTVASSPEYRTILARDVETGSSVVIKVIHTEQLSVGMQSRLEHQGARLLGAVCPWIARLLDCRRGRDALYFVAEYMEGETLAERLRNAALTPEEGIDLANCLLSGLKFLHDRGVHHRGMTPANIRLPREGVFARLVDIGCAISFPYDRDSCHSALNLARFLSPEQAGTIDQDVAPPANLYSVGTILFLALTGHAPFDGDDVGDILFLHVTAPVPELGQYGVAAPRVLEEILQRLLQKDPRDRYQTADAVLADLALVREALDRGDRDPQIVIGSCDHRLTLTEPSFVARREEMAALDGQLQRLQSGHAAFLSLEGQSGEGKSRLLGEFARRASRQGCWVLRGQATHEVAPQPMQLWKGIFDGIAAEARKDRQLAERIQSGMGENGGLLAATFSQLEFLLPRDAKYPIQQHLHEGVLLHAFICLFDALGSGERPVVVVLDDCQWADEFTTKLLTQWAADRRDWEAGDRSWCLVVSAFRAEEVEPTHPLRKLKSQAHLRLGPLAAEDIQSLAKSMAGELPADAVQIVVDASRGSPFMASAVLRSLVESGALTPQPGGWLFDESNRSRYQSSDYAARLLTERIELLDQDAIELLTVGAVLGRQFRLEVAAKIAGLDGPRFIEVVDQARTRHLVWLRNDESHCEFVHDRIREALLGRLHTEQRQSVHLRAAQTLEDECTAPADIAFHYDAAGWSQSALPFALKAAEKLRRQHALEAAEQQYRIAERAAAFAGKRCAYRIASGLGDVAMLRGCYDQAHQAFIQAAENASGRYEASAILGKMAELAFKRGKIEQAIRDFEHALAALGKPVPRQWLPVWLLAAWETLVQALHSGWPTMFVHRLQRQPTDEERLLLRLLSGLAHGYWYARGKANSFWAHLRGMNLAERYLATPELAQAYSEHAPGMTLIPLFRRATKYANKSLAIRRESGDVWGQAQSLHYHGCALYAASDFAGCIEKCREAIRLMERLGDYWQVHIARYQVAVALYHLGEFDAAVRESRRNYESGVRLGDQQATSLILDVWARAANGQIPSEVWDLEDSHAPKDAQTSSQVLLARGICLWYAGDYRTAAETIEGATRIAEQAGVRNAYTIPNYAWLATAHRSAAESISHATPFAREKHLSQAASAARASIRHARLCRNDLPRALREYALVLAMLGKLKRVRSLLTKSRQVAEEIHDRFEYAHTLMAYGRIGHELGWPESEDLAAQGRHQLAHLGPQSDASDEDVRSCRELATLSLADRFDKVLDSGRNIAGAIYETAIFRESRSAALRLLRGEKCLVLAIENSGEGLPFHPIAGDMETPYRPDLVRKAAESQSVVIADDLSGDFADEGSVICMPIVVRHRPAACLYVVHRRIRGLFGKDERRLAGFVTAIAGAALENAEGFRQLQELNRTLEERVQERTAAAEAASRAKSQFLATMSHEIRTPMNGILGMTELTLQTPLSRNQQTYLQTVKQSGEALLTLLNDVLDLSKIEAGKMELEQIAFPLRDVVTEAVSLLAPTAARKGIELTCRVDPTATSLVEGDPNRLRQILVNLIGNAVKFTDSGEIDVNVEVARERGTAEQLHFTVLDTGVGIAPDKLDSIFEAFRQSDSSTTRKFGGTGLGLSISHELVHLMGGRIWVESELDRGSTFHFVIPCHPVTDDSNEDAGSVQQGRLVLLVGHQSRSQQIHAEMLQRRGFQVRTIEWPDLASWQEQEEVVVVADFTCRDSFDVDRLSEDFQQERRPWIALVPPDGSASRFQSATEFLLIKPVKETQLSQTLQAAFGEAQRSKSADWHEASSVLPSLTILLADDSIVNQEVGKGMLELLGHAVTCANDGREAVNLFQIGNYDIVLMDLEMPEMDGIQAAREIRQWEGLAGRSSTPIIAMTAHTLDHCRQRFGGLEMDGHIQKPIQPEVLRRVLQETWHSVRPAQQLISSSE